MCWARFGRQVSILPEGQSVLAAIARAGGIGAPEGSKAACSETCSRRTNVFACWKSAVWPSLQNRRG